MKVTKLSIVVPALNEVATIHRVVKRLSALSLGIPYEVIFVDDGSTDGTTNYFKKLQKKKIKNFLFIYHEKPEGKGAAIISALRVARGSHIAVQDADEEYDPHELKKLIQAAVTTKTGVVFGSRNKHIKNRYLYPVFYWCGKVLNGAIAVLFNQRLTDPTTCMKMIPTTLMRSLHLSNRGFGLEMELICKLSMLNISISEVSIHYKPRTFEEGKKIHARDGIYFLYLVGKYKIESLFLKQNFDQY